MLEDPNSHQIHASPHADYTTITNDHHNQTSPLLLSCPKNNPYQKKKASETRPFHKHRSQHIILLCLLLLFTTFYTQPASAKSSDEDWVYYWIRNEKDSTYTMYKDRPDSPTQKPVKMTSPKYIVGSLTETKGYVYYIQHYNDGRITRFFKGYMYRIDKKTKKSKRMTSRYIYTIAAANETIYFSDQGTLYKMNPDGSKKEKLVDGHVTTIQISNGWLYHNDLDQKTINKVRLDGTDNQQLTSDDEEFNAYVSFFGVFGDWVEFGSKSKSDHSTQHILLNANDPEHTRIKLENSTRILDVTDDGIYIQRDNILYKKDIKTGDETPLSDLGIDIDLTKLDGYVHSYHFADGYLLYISKDNNLKKLTFAKPTNRTRE
ncbi:DUF5050 domain-containing protein [Brevibacillus fluminis]|uniref:DUF5050 domain-containing protein n=1 Tax=Brevibacillus fluminis TaxID=511487 RepID=UPI003F89F994